MSNSTQRIRWLLPAVFAAVAVAAPAAQASPKPERSTAALMALHFKHEDALYAMGQEVSQARPPAQLIALHFKHEDALYSAGRLGSGATSSARTQSYPDAFERAVKAHGSISYPDAFERAVNRSKLQVAPTPGTPDMRDAAGLARSQIVRIVQAGGFDWGDAGIGAGSATAFLLLLLAGGSLVLRHRQHVSRA